MIERYATAKDLFEAARDAVRERAAASAQLEHMRARRMLGSKPVGWSGGAQRRDVNGTSASNDLVDFEAMMRGRLAEDERLLDFAARVAYGEDGRGGVAALLGTGYADVLFWRYLNAETWVACGNMCHVAPATAKRRAMCALDAVDAVGIERAIDGQGIAAD